MYGFLLVSKLAVMCLALIVTVFFFAVVLCFGMRESSLINNVFTIVNLFVIGYIVICGLFQVDAHNWSIPAEEVGGNGLKHYCVVAGKRLAAK